MHWPNISAWFLTIVMIIGHRPRSVSAFALFGKGFSLQHLATRATAKSAQEIELVPSSAWRVAAAAHQERVRRLVGGRLTGYDGDHPIYNFLFRYDAGSTVSSTGSRLKTRNALQMLVAPAGITFGSHKPWPHILRATIEFCSEPRRARSEGGLRPTDVLCLTSRASRVNAR
jgi:hypothetical protein